jgi:hypothetical protein
MHCHPGVFADHYDSVKLNNSNQVRVDKFIKECCGAISIEETSETKEKGKYIVVVPTRRKSRLSKNSNMKKISRISEKRWETSGNGMPNSIPKLPISK